MATLHDAAATDRQLSPSSNAAAPSITITTATPSTESFAGTPALSFASSATLDDNDGSPMTPPNEAVPINSTAPALPAEYPPLTLAITADYTAIAPAPSPAATPSERNDQAYRGPLTRTVFAYLEAAFPVIEAFADHLHIAEEFLDEVRECGEGGVDGVIDGLFERVERAVGARREGWGEDGGGVVEMHGEEEEDARDVGGKDDVIEGTEVSDDGAMEVDDEEKRKKGDVDADGDTLMAGAGHGDGDEVVRSPAILTFRVQDISTPPQETDSKNDADITVQSKQTEVKKSLSATAPVAIKRKVAAENNSDRVKLKKTSLSAGPGIVFPCSQKGGMPQPGKPQPGKRRRKN